MHNLNTFITSKEEKPVVPKLCPFRKKTVFYQNDYTTNVEGEKVMLNLPRAEWMEEEFLPCIYEKCAVWNEKGQNCRDNCATNIRAVLAADVVPVRHGRWIRKRTVEHEGEWYCSICGKDMLYTWGPGCGLADYCPNCGAKMDKGE